VQVQSEQKQIHNLHQHCTDKQIWHDSSFIGVDLKSLDFAATAEFGASVAHHHIDICLYTLCEKALYLSRN
jgi:hypothetical protein